MIHVQLVESVESPWFQFSRPWRSAAGPSVWRCWSSFSLPPWNPSCADPPAVWGRKEEQRELMETQKIAEKSLCLCFFLENRWFFGCFWGVGVSGRLVFGDTQGSRSTKRLHWKLLLQISHQGLQVEAKQFKSWAISNASHRKTKKMTLLKKEEQTKLQTVLGPGYFGATFPSSGPCHNMPNNDLPPDPRWALHVDLTKLRGVQEVKIC